MAKSRILRPAALPLLLVAAPPALAAQANTPEEAVARQQAEVAELVSQVCPTTADAEDPHEVVVCGRRRAGTGATRDFRVPWLPGTGRIGRLPGEPLTGAGAMAAGGCMRLCHQPLKVDIIGAVRTLGRGLDRLLHPD